MRCATAPLPNHVNMDVISRTLRRGLRGQSYLGFIEPAFYVNVQSGLRSNQKKAVFWHLHALLWNIAPKEKRQLVRKLNEIHQAITSSHLGADARLIKPGEMARTVGYIMKMPENSYRLWRRRCDRHGRPLPETSNLFGQSKGALRPGERVAIFNMMRGLRLDQLTVAGGQGAAVLAAAKRLMQKELETKR